jgi:TRAP-type C4-dicarboxylate transport system substrate-binding protein
MPASTPFRPRALTALLIAGLLCTAPAPAAVQLKLATLAPRGSMYHRVLQDLDAVVRQSEGAGAGASAKIYTDGSQGGEADVVRRMRLGQLNGAMLSIVGLSEIDESVGALQKMPMLFHGNDEVEYVTRALRPELEKRLADKGFVALMWAQAGWVRFFCKAPAATPADLRERRVFAWSGDPQQVELMKRLGYRPVVLETADILPGLQTGLIDVVPLTPMWALATQADLQAPTMIDLPWAPIAGAVIITRKTWDDMTPATQAALRAAADRATLELNAYQERADREAIAAMQRRGLRVVHLDAAQQRAWDAFALEVQPLLRGRTVPATTYDAALRLVAEYRARPAGPVRAP